MAGRLFWGFMLLGAGTIFWLDRIGRIEARDYLVWWPLAAIVAGAVEFLDRRWVGAVIWLTIGTSFLLPMVGLPTFKLWYIIGAWPLFITVAGVMVIAHALRRPEKQRRGATFSSAAFMGANNRVVRSQGMVGGDVVAVMAGSEIEFAPVNGTSHTIELDVLTFWGGIEITVPIGWRIVNEVTPILGGYNDRTVGPHDGGPTLIIRGAAIMGGIDVKNSKEPA